MPTNNEIYNQPNNSKPDVTSTHETGKYLTPELQAAYDAGRQVGRTEGMIIYQRHLIENLQSENVKLNQKLQEQKGGSI